MEVDEIHCNFPGITNGAGSLLAHVHKMDEEEDAGRDMNKALSLSAAAAVDLGGGLGRLYGWPSSRIVRVSRASGGKDRHSKVLTSKGLRDRRVRLSVNTAIQFYDLQDRLGYDQPSKAVEWLLKAAAASIAELPPMSSPFPDTPPKQLSDEKRSTAAASDHLCFESPEVEMDGGDPRFSQATTKSSSAAAAACSSTSETSLTRSESRIKARERAKGRVADRDQKESEPNPISQTTSFTELLSGGGRNWSSAPMDYFTSGLFRPPQMHEGNQFTFGSGQQELQHISFLSDLSNHHHNHNGDNYNLNFAISSSSADNSSSGFSRGTLQSNSSPPPTYANNINSDGFYIGTTAAAAAVENHHRFQSGYYGTNNNNNEQKGKGKN